MLSIWKLYSVDDRIIDEFGTVGEIKIERGHRSV
jgi:hypothetical protein